MRNVLVTLFFTIMLVGCGSFEKNTSEPMINMHAKVIADQQLAKNPGGVRQCHEVEAVIPRGGKIEGPNCNDNKTVVNGWSEKCVANGACNAGQRRRELNQAAKTFCVNWCAAKKCDFSYMPRSQCDSSKCRDSRFCQTNCDLPKRDTCYFQQTAPNYNCECMDPPPGLPPSSLN